MKVKHLATNNKAFIQKPINDVHGKHFVVYFFKKLISATLNQTETVSIKLSFRMTDHIVIVSPRGSE